MRRFIIGMLALCSLGALTACEVAPVLTAQSRGFWHGQQGAASQPITVDNASGIGFDVVGVTNWYDNLVGRPTMMEAFPRGDAWGHNNANIIFRERTMERAFWVDVRRDGNGWTTQVVVWYDPRKVGTNEITEEVLKHEFAHALGYTNAFGANPGVDGCDPNYKGVASYWFDTGCNGSGWYVRAHPGWGGEGDRAMVTPYK